MRWVRRKGYRVNLRYLAEVQTLGWLVLTWFTLWGFYRLCQLVASLGASSLQQNSPPQFQHRQYVQPRTAQQYAGSEVGSSDTGPSIFDDF